MTSLHPPGSVVTVRALLLGERRDLKASRPPSASPATRC